ncbi:MAG: hypothetical protein O3A00_10680 [Planctomycetota bacterium]|nr:hypothetical protein [Planctomycetota bacterium]
MTECPKCRAEVGEQDNGVCRFCGTKVSVPLQQPEDSPAARQDASVGLDFDFDDDEEEEVIVVPAPVAPARGQLIPCVMCGAYISPNAACPTCGESTGRSRFRRSDDSARSHLDVARDGRQIVAGDLTEFPRRCPKTNETDELVLKRETLYWYPPWVWIALLMCGLIPGVIVAMIVRRQVVLSVWYSRTFLRRRFNKMLAGCLGFFGSLGGIFVALSQRRVMEELVAASIVGLLASLIFLLVVSPKLRLKKVHGRHAWISGINADFLDSLPEWDHRGR